MRTVERGILVLGLLLSACADGSVASTSTEETTMASLTTTTTASSTTTTLATTTTVGREQQCQVATDEVIETMDVILDRIESDPQSFIDDPDSSMEDLGGEMGSLIADECGAEYGGQAFSELLVFLANDSSERTLFAQNVIEGMLEGLCADPPVELTLRGRGACAGN